MANVMISELPQAIIPLAPLTTYFEVEAFESGIQVSRRINVSDLISAAGGVATVVAGTNIDVDSTDPANPIVSVVAAITGVSVNGVTLSNAGAGNLFLADDGSYAAVPPGIVSSVVGGTNITVDSTDPFNPVVNLDAAITGVSVNGVTLSPLGLATEYLNGTGTYTTPAGGGQVNTVVGGTNITVDATDPINPVVNLDAAITGVSVNGVTLSNAGAATNYLDETGAYSVPAGGGGGLPAGSQFNTAYISTAPSTYSAADAISIDPANTVIFNMPTTVEHLRLRTDGGWVHTVSGAYATPVLLGGNTPLHVATGDGSFFAAMVSNANSVGGVNFSFVKSRGGVNGGVTAVLQDDKLGIINFWGLDGANANQSARMEAAVDAAVSGGIVPSRFSFQTTSSTGSLLERLRIDSQGQVTITANGSAFAAPPLVNGIVQALVVQGPNATASIANTRYSNDAGGAFYNLVKSRGAIGAQGAVTVSDSLGRLDWYGSDGTNFLRAARIDAIVVGAVSANVMPTDLSLQTTPSGSGTARENMRLFANGGGSILDGNGSAQQIGYNQLVLTTKNTAYNFAANDVGRLIRASATVTWTVTTAVPGVGFFWSLMVDGGAGVTLVQGAGTTLRWFNGSGSVPTGNRTLALGAVATLVYAGSSQYWLYGTGIT